MVILIYIFGYFILNGQLDSLQLGVNNLALYDFNESVKEPKWGALITGKHLPFNFLKHCGATIIHKQWLLTAAHCFLIKLPNGTLKFVADPAAWYVTFEKQKELNPVQLQRSIESMEKLNNTGLFSDLQGSNFSDVLTTTQESYLPIGPKTIVFIPKKDSNYGSYVEYSYVRSDNDFSSINITIKKLNDSMYEGGELQESILLEMDNLMRKATITIAPDLLGSFTTDTCQTKDELNHVLVEKIIIAPNYRPRLGINDIAIMKLNDPIPAEYLEPNGTLESLSITSKFPNQTAQCFLVDTGCLDNTSNSNKINHKFRLISKTDCDKSFSNRTDHHEFCASSDTLTPKMCQSECGSSLVCDINGKRQVVGVLSYGHYRKSYVARFTKIKIFKRWIEAKIRRY